LGCTDRNEECHSVCERYKKEKAELEERKKVERKRKRDEYVQMKAIAEAKKRMIKKRR
jgi:hypothetical protein